MTTSTTNASTSAASEHRFRPTTRLCIPLQTGNGFAMSLFMWGFFWMPSLAVGLVGILLLVLGHWLLGPIFALVGAFFVGAFWTFPREVWVARPCDLELDAEGFRVVGGHHAGVRLGWDELDAAACGVRDGSALLTRELFAVTRQGKQVPVAEGDEYESFAAVLDAWRASAGLEPASPAAPSGKKRRRDENKGPAKPVTVELVNCGRCGAAACPQDSATSTCLYCGEAVPMLESVRGRLREHSSHAALQARSQKTLARLLAQPRAPLTMLLLGLLGVAMLAAWLFGGFVLSRALVRHAVDLMLVLGALAAPLLLTLALASLASVVAARRVAVRAVTVEFAAIAPPGPGKPCSCRVCGAPLPQLDVPVLRCAYCSSFNIVSSARPRQPSRVQDRLKSLEETLSAQGTEQLVRWLFVAVIGVPALWGALGALRFLWARL